MNIIFQINAQHRCSCQIEEEAELLLKNQDLTVLTAAAQTIIIRSKIVTSYRL